MINKQIKNIQIGLHATGSQLTYYENKNKGNNSKRQIYKGMHPSFSFIKCRLNSVSFGRMVNVNVELIVYGHTQ